MNNLVFHEPIIGDLRFEAFLNIDGPSIAAGDGGVALGACAIAQAELDQTAWWVVKRPSERRICLKSLSDVQIRQLAHEFGILTQATGRERAKPKLFFASPAFAALRRWVTEYPRLAQRYAQFDSHLPGWYVRALAGRRRAAPAASLAYLNN